MHRSYSFRVGRLKFNVHSPSLTVQWVHNCTAFVPRPTKSNPSPGATHVEKVGRFEPCSVTERCSSRVRHGFDYTRSSEVAGFAQNIPTAEQREAMARQVRVMRAVVA